MIIFLTLFILTLVIVVHEFGHFVVAKYFKVKVLEFSIGMGTKIYSKGIFSIRLLPLGGYVKLDEKTLEDISKIKQICIMIAGIIMNLILAYLCILLLNGIKPVRAFIGLITTIKAYLIAIIHITSLKDLSGPIGIHLAVVNTTKMLGIFKGSSLLIVMISINLAIVNLLPIPGLDGSRIYITLIKMIGVKISKKIEEKIYIVGFLILITLTILVMFQDVLKLI